ncbi:hypothetical protein CTEN210_08697 [Chaetoceros tenuissimus]|uniref:SAP domain-containing protein n=1 Tax=Chaetoceros tenuissimus TaxID=426638 RepID=A0AAD3CUB3_9STRA|nr:hypothetical protein CTEN210_08697 [Chaetoceros tenuissimus]
MISKYGVVGLLGFLMKKMICRHSFIVLLLVLTSLELGETFSSPSNNDRPERHISASQRARRDEELRRKERVGEVAPGKTSAIPGAKDFELNVKRTELDWVAEASGTERILKELHSKGMESLRLLRLDEANEAFNQLYQIKPNSYCWQAGIVKFYLQDYHGAAECFAKNANYYESRFGQIATEERIWRDACEVKLMNLSKRKYKSIKPPLAQLDEEDLLAPKETRKVLRITSELFKASIENDLTSLTLARAKLRSICGDYDNDEKKSKVIDRKMWKLNSWYFLGLHYDVIGETEASKDCMKMALRQCISGNGDDIIQILPMLHMSRRDWFDDEEFESDDGFENENDFSEWYDASMSPEDMKNNIEEKLVSMKLTQLQEALRFRGLSSKGSKSVLKDRLRSAFFEEEGLQS